MGEGGALRCTKMPLASEVAAGEIPHANLDPADIAHRVQTKARLHLSDRMKKIHTHTYK